MFFIVQALIGALLMMSSCCVLLKAPTGELSPPAVSRHQPMSSYSRNSSGNNHHSHFLRQILLKFAPHLEGNSAHSHSHQVLDGHEVLLVEVQKIEMSQQC